MIHLRQVYFLTHLLVFGGIVAAAATWTMFGGDMFPAEPDPKGDPESWTREEMRRWLAAVGLIPCSNTALANGL